MGWGGGEGKGKRRGRGGGRREGKGVKAGVSRCIIGGLLVFSPEGKTPSKV